jgi:hypothetical protein
VDVILLLVCPFEFLVLILIICETSTLHIEDVSCVDTTSIHDVTSDYI